MKELVAKTITFLICPFAAYGFGTAIHRTISAAVLPKQALIAFAVGFILFIILWIIFKRHLQVVCTFEHELTHLLFELLFLKRPHSFVVTRHDGGSVTLSGGNFLITLAPYFFPTVSYLLLPVIYFVSKSAMPVFLALLGGSVAFHLVSTWAELHWRQTDLHKAGIMFSAIFLPVANLIFYGALTALVCGGASGFSNFWINGTLESYLLLETLNFEDFCFKITHWGKMCNLDFCQNLV